MKAARYPGPIALSIGLVALLAWIVSVFRERRAPAAAQRPIAPATASMVGATSRLRAKAFATRPAPTRPGAFTMSGIMIWLFRGLKDQAMP